MGENVLEHMQRDLLQKKWALVKSKGQIFKGTYVA